MINFKSLQVTFLFLLCACLIGSNAEANDDYLNSGREHKALREIITHLDAYIETNPQDAEAYFDRGLAKLKLGKHQEAINNFDRAIEIDPQFAEAYYYRGRIKATLRRYKEASADYNTAMKINPQLSNDILLTLKLVKVMETQDRSHSCASPLI